MNLRALFLMLIPFWAMAQERSLGGTCDALVGPEKAHCLQQGGTVEVSSADLGYWQALVRDASTIEAAQRALRAEGYDPGPADGSVHAKTVQAVKQAQKDRELEPTGQLDRRTLAALGIDVESSASAGGSAPRN